MLKERCWCIALLWKEEQKIPTHWKIILFALPLKVNLANTAGLNKSVSSATSALTMKSKPCVQVSNWRFHLLPEVSQLMLMSLKWIIKSYSNLLSQGGCHSCQMSCSSNTACLLIVPSSCLMEMNSTAKCYDIKTNQTATLNWKKM